jgi:hypothetical protein
VWKKAAPRSILATACEAQEGRVILRRSIQCRAVPVAALVALCACRGGDGASAASAEERGPDPGVGKPVATAAAVRTNTVPKDNCGWLTAGEVEAVVGKLTGTPHQGPDGCVYPLPVDHETARRRARALELQKKLEERFGKSDMPELKADESGVVIDVETYDDPARGRAAGAAFAMMGKWLDDDGDSTATASVDTAPSPALPGWDVTNAPTRASFHGRLGFVRVSVMVQDAEVSREQAVTLANRIRGKIADLPFPSERSGLPASPDPCTLLTAQEAETVLGKLVVAPYRSDDGKPLAVANGNSCSYLTAGHHALVLRPTWEYGGTAYEATRMGGIVEKIAPGLHEAAADTLDEGPWEEAGANSATGELYFLNGDRFLEVGYLASSTGMSGAVRLARIAMARLGSGEKGRTTSAAAAAKPAGGGCPSVEQVGQAAGFPVTFMQSLGAPPDRWSQCHYEMTGRYRGNYLELSRQPASLADPIFAEMQHAVKAMKGSDAKADRIALGSGGWAFGSNSRSEAAAVFGSQVWRAKLSYMLAGDIGDQKEAMVHVLEAVAR